jgi:hypothetical protein
MTETQEEKIPYIKHALDIGILSHAGPGKTCGCSHEGIDTVRCWLLSSKQGSLDFRLDEKENTM